jgi:acetyl esterase/lipase
MSNDIKLEKIPTPYSILRNPYLSWADVFMCYMFPYLWDASPLNRDLDPKTADAAEKLAKIRKVLEDMPRGFMGKAAVKKWSDATGGSRLAEYNGEIPFQKNILKDWNILSTADNDKILPVSMVTREIVKVMVRFPSELLSDEQRENAEILDYSGCLEVKELDLKSFAVDVPILVQFHGGGQIMGVSQGLELLDDVPQLVRLYAEEHETAPPNVITVSVDYGLAPEHPFPTAIMDCLSVIEYFLAGTRKRKLHLMGMSAGAYLSLVAGMEAYRKYPGRILSIESQCPMVTPSCDSMSFYMNQKAIPTAEMLRWSWRAVLGLDAPEKPSDKTPTTVKEAFRAGSNYTAWNEWKVKQSEPLQRLADPLLGLPDGLDKNAAPMIIVRVNKGDPLHDEGKELVDLLEKKNANVTFFSDSGLHCNIGGVHDADGHKQLMMTWSNIVFGSSQ